MNALPAEPICPKLSTLFLQKNPNLEFVTEAFFIYMKSLRVLNLYDTWITSLPSSLWNLISLKALYLQKCLDLVELLSDFVKLDSLKVLDAQWNGLASVPPQVTESIHIEWLLVSFARNTPLQNTSKDVDLISKMQNFKKTRNRGWRKV